MTEVVTPREEVLHRPVESLDLGVRARKALESLGIDTINDLIEATEPELMSCRNFGKVSLYEIVSKLKDLDLQLSDYCPEERKTFSSLRDRELAKKIEPWISGIEDMIQWILENSEPCQLEHALRFKLRGIIGLINLSRV